MTRPACTEAKEKISHINKEGDQCEYILLKLMNSMNSQESMEFLLNRMKGTRDNAEFLISMNG